VIAPKKGAPVRVLVTSGGFGVGPTREIVRSLAGVAGVAVTVVCGASAQLRDQVERDAQDLGAAVAAIGYERDMPARVRDAHVVVGKAGGLTVSETLTSGRPMIVVGAVPGNEKLNEAFVVGSGAGVVASPGDVGAAVVALRASGALAHMGALGRAAIVRNASGRVLGVTAALAGRRSRAA